MFREVLMKHCYKWMLFCVAAALAVYFILPKFGIAVGGASLLVLLLMIGCCVLPMLFIMKSGIQGDKGSCCSKGSKSSEATKEADKDVKGGAGSCH